MSVVHGVWPKEKLQTNRQDSNKEEWQDTKSRISEYHTDTQGTWAPATTLYVLCKLQKGISHDKLCMTMMDRTG